MALNFAGVSTANVNVGSGASIDNLVPTTFAAWVKPSALTGGRRIFAKGQTVGFHFFGIAAAGTGRLGYVVDYNTTNANGTTNDGALTTGAWQFVAGTFDGVTPPKVYVGSLTALVAEVPSYSTSVAPAGGLTSDAAQNLYIGNEPGSSIAFPGDIAWVGRWSRVLTIGELIEQQFNRHAIDGCVLNLELGWNGTGIQPDWSGYGNAGTVTGATVSAHVPISPSFSAPAWVRYAVAGAGAPATSDTAAIRAAAILAASGAKASSAAAIIGATGRLAATGGRASAQTAFFAATGRLAATGTKAGASTADERATGRLSAVSTSARSAQAALRAGARLLATSAAPAYTDVAALMATVRLVATGARASTGTAVVTAYGRMAVSTVAAARAGVAAFRAGGRLSATGIASRSGTLALWARGFGTSTSGVVVTATRAHGSDAAVGSATASDAAVTGATGSDTEA